MNKITLFFISVFLLTRTLPAFAIEDFIQGYIEKNETKPPETNLQYNYLDTRRIPIHLHITEKISTRDKSLFEGQKLYFISDSTVYDKDKVIIKKNDKIEGKLKYVITSGMNGIPYSLTVGEFRINGVDKNKLVDEYYKQGWDRGYLVFPIKWALTFLPPTGSLTNFIKGGHCKITPNDTITLYYYPYWGEIF